jgi:hypothetical protein
MLIDNIDPNVKKHLRELASKALDAELEQPLGQLAEAFDLWKVKSITNLDLDRRIYDFERGRRKELAELYDSTSADVLVARAIGRRILAPEQIPQEISNLLQSLITQFKEGLVNF